MTERMTALQGEAGSVDMVKEIQHQLVLAQALTVIM